jgi:deazaflavin-dependent oxidoreductase (nitroreductase family)
MLAFNRRVIEEHRATGGRLSGPMAGRKLMLLTTTGARTGQPRTAVLGYGVDGDRCVVLASNNGAAEHPAWYRNLVADPRVTVEVGGDRFEARARTASGEERTRLAALIPWFESQQALTSREIPIVALERAAG